MDYIFTRKQYKLKYLAHNTGNKQYAHICFHTYTHTLKFKYATESGLFPCFELINAP